MTKYSILSLTLVLLLLLSVGTEGFIRDEEPEHDTWPWMVHIWHGHGKQDGDVIGCAGSLISNYHVLTSPYCAQHDPDEGQLHDDIGGLTLRMGDNHLGDLRDLSDGHPTVTRKAFRVYVHSLWHDNDEDVTIKANEIAIIVMNESVDFSQSIQPIKIAAANLNPSGMSAVVAGWGQMRALIAANATILDDKNCSWGTNYTREPQLNFANQEEAIKILTRALEQADSITQTPKDDDNSSTQTPKEDDKSTTQIPKEADKNTGQNFEVTGKIPKEADKDTGQILEATDKIPKEADKDTTQIHEAIDSGTTQIPKATEGATQYYELSTAVGTIIIDPKQSEPGNYEVLNFSEPTSLTDPMRNETNLLIGIALSRGNNCSRKNGTDTIDYDSCQPVPSRIDKHLEIQYTKALLRLPKYSVRQKFPVRNKVAQSDKDSLMCTDFLGLSCTPCTGDVGGPLVINFPRNKSRHHKETESVESGTSTQKKQPNESRTSEGEDQDKKTQPTEHRTSEGEDHNQKTQSSEPRTSEGADHVQPTNTSQEPVPQIVGIIVHNPLCHNYEDTIFYTKVSYFNQWIHNITGPIIDGSVVDIASIEPELFNRLQTIASQEATNQSQTTASQEGANQSQTKADNDITDITGEPTEDPPDDISSNLIANGTPIGTTDDTNKDTSEESPGNKNNNPANGGCNSKDCNEDVNDKKKDLWTSRMIKLIIAVIILAAVIVAVHYAKRDSEKEDRRRNLFKRKRRPEGKTCSKSQTKNRGEEDGQGPLITTTETNNDHRPITS